MSRFALKYMWLNIVKEIASFLAMTNRAEIRHCERSNLSQLDGSLYRNSSEIQFSTFR